MRQLTFRNIFLILIFLLQVTLFFPKSALAQQTAESKFIPKCVLDAPTGNRADEGECRSISIFIILMFNIINYLFGIVGALALLFFIYGGFVLILSRGNSEQTSKGIGILTAAVIGLVVVFGAYMLVRFLGTAVDLKGDYTLNP
jgi:hypothetical protein